MRQYSRFTPYLYVLPLVLLLAFVFGYPLVRIFEFSFKLVRGIDGPWIGFRNYDLILGQDLFWDSVRHNLFLLLAVPAMVIWSLLISIVLYERIKGWKLYRIVLFFPYILAIPIIAVVMKKMFQLSGPVNEVLNGLHLDFLALDWIGSSDVALWTVMLLIIWRESALGIILFLARLLSLPGDLYEAIKVDGAGFWRSHWHVTLPMMRSIIGFYVVIEGITLFSWVFSYVYVMTRGGPGDATQVTETYIYDNAFTSDIPWLAASAATVLLLGFLVLAAAFLVFRAVLPKRSLG